MNDLDNWMKLDFEPLDDKLIEKMKTTIDYKTTIRKLNNDLKILMDFSKPKIRYLIKGIVADLRLRKKYNTVVKKIRVLEIDIRNKNKIMIQQQHRIDNLKEKLKRKHFRLIKKRRKRDARIIKRETC